MDCSRCSGCWQQDIRVLEAEKSHHEQCQIHGSGGAAPKRRVMLRNKRPDSHHLRLKFPDKDHVLGEIWYGEPTMKPQPVW